MKYEIKKLEEHEVRDTIKMFRSIVDELHADSSKAERSHYKATHPVNKVKKQLNDKNSVYLIGKREMKSSALCFPWFLMVLAIYTG